MPEFKQNRGYKMKGTALYDKVQRPSGNGFYMKKKGDPPSNIKPAKDIVTDIAKTMINPGGKVVSLAKRAYDYFKGEPTSESKPKPGPRETKQTTPQGSEGKGPTGKVKKKTGPTATQHRKLEVPEKLKGKQATTISRPKTEKSIVKKQKLTPTVTKTKKRRKRKNK
mgnify:CR=1 FL=1|tara:strand:+ start:292 stop:792 length:501 start_codon:yes stop_codon:yes gene_type:complete